VQLYNKNEEPGGQKIPQVKRGNTKGKGYGKNPRARLGKGRSDLEHIVHPKKEGDFKQKINSKETVETALGKG